MYRKRGSGAIENGSSCSPKNAVYMALRGYPGAPAARRSAEAGRDAFSQRFIEGADRQRIEAALAAGGEASLITNVRTERGVVAHVLLRGHGGKLKGPTRVALGRHTSRHVGDEALLHGRGVFATQALAAGDSAPGVVAPRRRYPTVTAASMTSPSTTRTVRVRRGSRAGPPNSTTSAGRVPPSAGSGPIRSC